MEITSIRTRIFKINEPLFPFVASYLPQLKNGDIIAVTSKIVALSEGRVATNEEKIKKQIIKRESSQVIKGKWCYLTFKDGEWCANAGVDESNSERKIILLPKDAMGEAKKLRSQLKINQNIRNLGVIITDTRSIPLRQGVMGVALSYTGFKGLKNYIGKKDIFGRKFKITRSNMADALAVAAVAVMGEGNERTPLAVIRDAPVSFKNVSAHHRELSILPKDDLYCPIYINPLTKS